MIDKLRNFIENNPTKASAWAAFLLAVLLLSLLAHALR